MNAISRNTVVPALSQVLLTLVFLVGLVPGQMFAQTQNSASLVGKVTDGKSVPLPGVSISVTGPQLQVAQLTATSGEDGSYQVLNLPAPGVYTITVTLQGFEKFVRSGINLGVGFAGRVDIPMKIGEVSQTVEVQGGSPVIDTQSSGTTSSLDEEAIQEAPKGMTMQEMLPMAKGVSMQGTPDVGDSNLAARSAVITYGVVLVPNLNYETVNMNTDKAADTAFYLDAFAIQEAEFKAVGNNADVAFPGVLQEAVMKSGSNAYHGHVRGDYENPTCQSKNTTTTTLSAPLAGTGYYDYSADLGGRILRDKLWGYGGYSFQGVNQGEPNFVAAPGVPGNGTCNYANYWLLSACPTAKQATVITSLREYDMKFSYQMKPRVKLLGVYAHGAKFLSDQGFSPTVPLVAGMYQHQPSQLYHVEVQVPFSPRFLLDAGFGHDGDRAIYISMPASQIGSYGYTKGSNFAGSPSQEELSTKSFTGPYYFPQNRAQYRYEMKVFASFIPTGQHLGGTHQIKFGTVEDWENAGTYVLAENASGDYLLQFSNVAAAATATTQGCIINITPNGCPSAITLYNFPFPNSTNRLTSYSGYVIDQWTHKRLTLNVGVRGETYIDGYPTQTKTPGHFATLFPSVSYPGQSILTWTDVVPRVGGAFDIFGDGKTVLKGSFGMFGDTMGDLYAGTFNPDAEQTATFKWTNTNPGGAGACQPTAGTTSITVGPAATTPIQYNCDVTDAYLLSLAAGAAAGTITPQSVTGAITQVLNPGLKQDKTYEYAVSIERQIVPNVSVTASYINHHIYNLYTAQTNALPADSATYNGTGINVGHPLSSYTVPLTYTDSFNGVSTSKTVYTYCTTALETSDPTHCPAGSNLGTGLNEVLNNPSNRPDYFNSFDIAIVKKYSKRWTGSAYFWGTKNNRWINGLAGVTGSPNDNLFPLDTVFNWEARGDLTYNLPWGFRFLTFYRAASGTPGQRTVSLSTATDPSIVITPTVPTQTVSLSQGATTLAEEPYGTERGPFISVWNVKGVKIFKFKDHYSAEANFQLYNVLNTNAPVGISYLTTTFGTASTIVAPRVFRIGGVFSF